MQLDKFLLQAGLTKYKLAKKADLPQTTIIDIFSGKTKLTKCSVMTVYKIAQALNVTMEQLLESEINRLDFEVFKSNVCHQVKDLGDLDFIVEMLEADQVEKLYEKGWYPEAFYVLAMIDYLSRINNVPLYNQYNNLRNMRLKKPLYPASIIALGKVNPTSNIIDTAFKNAIPEFLRFNIIESEIKNVA